MSGCIFRLSISFLSKALTSSLSYGFHVFVGSPSSFLWYLSQSSGGEKNLCRAVGEWVCKICQTLSRTIKCQRMLLAAQIVGYTYSTNKFVFSTYTILFVLKVDLWVATDYVFYSLSSEFIVLKYRMQLCQFQHEITCQYANDWSQATAWFVLAFLGHPT